MSDIKPSDILSSSARPPSGHEFPGLAMIPEAKGMTCSHPLAAPRRQTFHSEKEPGITSALPLLDVKQPGPFCYGVAQFVHVLGSLWIGDPGAVYIA